MEAGFHQRSTGPKQLRNDRLTNCSQEKLLQMKKQEQGIISQQDNKEIFDPSFLYLFVPQGIWLNFKLFKNMTSILSSSQATLHSGRSLSGTRPVKPMGKSPLEPTSWWSSESSGLSAQVWDGRASNLLSIQKDLSKC